MYHNKTELNEEYYLVMDFVKSIIESKNFNYILLTFDSSSIYNEEISSSPKEVDAIIPELKQILNAKTSSLEKKITHIQYDIKEDVKRLDDRFEQILSQVKSMSESMKNEMS